jgi:hypothetical protein
MRMKKSSEEKDGLSYREEGRRDEGEKSVRGTRADSVNKL